MRTIRMTPTRRALLTTASLASLLASPLAAQSMLDSIDTPRGRCGLWAMPNGGSDFPRDASYSRCALDRAPSPAPDVPMPPAPKVVGSVGAAYRIVVNADGTVDSALSRSSTVSFGTEFLERGFDFADQALRTIQRWRFAPGTRAGVAVRSVLDIEVITDARARDTLPAHLEWRYAAGTDRDSLVGRWVSDPPLPPFAAAQVDSVHAALVRQLSAMGVVLPAPTRRYCLANAGETSMGNDVARLATLSRLLSAHIDTLTPERCVDGATLVRLALPRVHRLEAGRFVLDVAGAQLPRWPFDFDARAWGRWRGRCVGELRDNAQADIDCAIAPDVSPAEMSAWYSDRRAGSTATTTHRAPRDDAPVTLTVLARSSHSYRIDTLRATVASVPSLALRTVRDSAPLCNRWSAWAPSDSGAYAVYGDFAETSLRVTPANRRPVPDESPRDAGCARPAGRAPALTAFLLGGIGVVPRAPVTICVSSCARRYVLDPARHLLADQPHLRFAPAQLRDPPTRDHHYFHFRLVVDPAHEGLVPFAIVTEPGHPVVSAWRLRALGDGMWEWPVMYSGPWTRREILVYLARP